MREGHAFGIVFHKPFLHGNCGGEDLDVFAIAGLACWCRAVGNPIEKAAVSAMTHPRRLCARCVRIKKPALFRSRFFAAKSLIPLGERGGIEPSTHD
jgi:hypothetical protein